MVLSVVELAFIAAALRQLAPASRELFEARVAALLCAQHDPGPGDVDRALRDAWASCGWTPPADEDVARHFPQSRRRTSELAEIE